MWQMRDVQKIGFFMFVRFYKQKDQAGKMLNNGISIPIEVSI